MSGDNLAKTTRSPFSKSKYFLPTSILESKTKKTKNTFKMRYRYLKRLFQSSQITQAVHWPSRCQTLGHVHIIWNLILMIRYKKSEMVRWCLLCQWEWPMVVRPLRVVKCLFGSSDCFAIAIHILSKACYLTPSINRQDTWMSWIKSLVGLHWMQRCKAAPNNTVMLWTKTVKDIKLLRPIFAEETFVSFKNKFFIQNGPVLKNHPKTRNTK